MNKCNAINERLTFHIRFLKISLLNPIDLSTLIHTCAEDYDSRDLHTRLS